MVWFCPDVLNLLCLMLVPDWAVIVLFKHAERVQSQNTTRYLTESPAVGLGGLSPAVAVHTTHPGSYASSPHSHQHRGSAPPHSETEHHPQCAGQRGPPLCRSRWIRGLQQTWQNRRSRAGECSIVLWIYSWRTSWYKYDETFRLIRINTLNFGQYGTGRPVSNLTNYQVRKQRCSSSCYNLPTHEYF